MNKYQLAAIPKFGKDRKELRRAASSRDWAKLIEIFESQEPSNQPSVLANLAEFIFVEGFLIVRFPDEKVERRRDKFTAWLDSKSSSLLDEHGCTKISQGIEYSRAIEPLYRNAYAKCCQLADRYDPIGVVWASIRLGQQEYIDWYSQAKAATERNPNADRISERLRTLENGFEATFTDISFKIDTVLQRELRFLGEQNGWMQGVLKIPSPRKAVPTQVAKDRRNALAILDKVEETDSRCRLFLGDLVRFNSDLAQMKGKVTSALFPVDWQIALTVAGERLQRRIDQLHDRFKSRESGHSEGPHRSIQEFLQAAEEPEHLVLEELTGNPVAANSGKFAGLTAWEWIRGYSTLRFLTQHYLLNADDISDPGKISRSSILEVLGQHGLSPTSSEQFVERCCFNRKSVDLHDCPLIQVGNDALCLLLFPANTQSVTRLVLSQLSKLGVRFDEKGTVLEDRLSRLLTSHGIRCGSFHRKGRDEVEIDQLAIWDDTLFVFECKFYGLPSENGRHQFAFCSNQADAASQLRSKVEAIGHDSQIVCEAIDNDVTWTRVVPVVLNGMPFSLPGIVNGVHYTDYASLETFFGIGKLFPFTSESSVSPDFAESTEPINLWSGAKPVLADLTRMLDANPHFQILASKWKPELITVEVSESRYFCSNVLSRQRTEGAHTS